MEKNYELYFSNETEVSDDLIYDLFSKVMEHTIKFMKLKGTKIISCTLVGLEKSHQVNKEYRHIDRPTDVISFAYNDNEDVVLEVDDLGEIVICLDIARKQAQEYAHPVMRELAFLFIHGFLHLLGYDHVNDEEKAKIMFALQNDILNSFEYDYKEI